MTLRTATRRALLYPAAAAASDWWLSGGINAANAIAVYQPIGAASLAASYVNLANPGTYDAAPGVAPTFNTATGWTFNGTTQYLDTGVTPTSLDWSVFVRFSDISQNSTVCGSLDLSTSRFQLTIRTVDSDRIYGNGNSLFVSPKTDVAGVMGFAGVNAYFDGAGDGTISGGTRSPNEIAIGALRTSSTITGFTGGKIQAIAIYDTVLTSGQAAAVSTAMAAL